MQIFPPAKLLFVAFLSNFYNLEMKLTPSPPNLHRAIQALFHNQLTVFFSYSSFTLLQAINPSNNPSSGVPLPPMCIKRILYQILRAIACCHGKGVVHRNIKPKHLILSGPRSLAITDCQAANENTELVIDDLNHCIVQLSDFALVRTSCNPVRKFTQEVVTLW